MIKVKMLIYFLMIFFIASLVLSSVQATKVALIVKDSSALSIKHEKNINKILTEMDLDVTLVDKDIVVDYSQFDLIVVAGRPGDVYSYEHLDSFVADLPVNDYPTVAVDFSYLDDWSWILPGGTSTLYSSGIQKIEIIDDSTAITEGYEVGQIVETLFLTRETMVDLVEGKYRLTPIASTVTNLDNPVIAVAEAGSQLYNDQTNKARIVFFGITNPLFWTDESIELFKNSVNWTLSDLDGDGVYDYRDNCPLVFNPSQRDIDGDNTGDVCDNCPLAYNPDQSDIDEDGIGDACGILPYQIFLDVDDDGVDETAINDNNITDDGFEVYYDSNSNSRGISIDGDFDGMTDWLIDTNKNGRYEKYWDPDDGILTDINRVGYDYYIDTDGDGEPDIIYNSFYKAFVIKIDVDSDSKLEAALDVDLDGSYDDYNDQDHSTKLLQMIDGDDDGKNDFIIGVDEPQIYWDPDDGIVTDIISEDVDNDEDIEYLIDVDGDGEFEKIFNEGDIHDSPDIIVEKPLLNPSSPTPGQDVEITATIRNDGNYDADNFIVEFKLDGTTQVNKSISLRGSSSTDLKFNWDDAPAGMHVIEIIADSTDVIMESNENNNNDAIDVSVGPTQEQGSEIASHTKVIHPWEPMGTAEFVGFPEKVEAFIDDNVTVEGKFVNNLNYNLYDFKLSLDAEGLNPEWYTTSPELNWQVVENESKDIKIEFNIPKDADIYTYDITLKAIADSKVEEKTFTESFSLILLEKLPVLTTTVPTTTIPEEEPEPSPLTGLYLFVQSNPLLTTIIIIIIVGIFYSIIPKGKGKYIFGRGWTKFMLKFKYLSIQGLKSLLTKW